MEGLTWQNDFVLLDNDLDSLHFCMVLCVARLKVLQTCAMLKHYSGL